MQFQPVVRRVDYLSLALGHAAVPQHETHRVERGVRLIGVRGIEEGQVTAIHLLIHLLERVEEVKVGAQVLEEEGQADTRIPELPLLHEAEAVV